MPNQTSLMHTKFLICRYGIENDSKGDCTAAHDFASDGLLALQSYEGLPAPVWILGFP